MPSPRRALAALTFRQPSTRAMTSGSGDAGTSSVSKQSADRLRDANGLREFLDASPTPFHAVANLSQRLLGAGFKRLSERDVWSADAVKPGGKYFTTRNQSSIVAFALGGARKSVSDGFAIIGTHTDSCCFKVRPISKRESAGFLQVGCETYGGGLWHTWLDRDLGLAGRVVTSTPGSGSTGPSYTTHLVRIARPLLRIPTIAIHLDRTQNEAMKYNTESNMVPILALAKKQLNEPAATTSSDASKPDPLSLASKHHPLLVQILAEELTKSTGSTISPEAIHDFELSTFDCQPAAFSGATEEFLLSARLDNLFSTWCAVEGLIKSVEGEDALAVDRTTRVTACWDNEEVGSTSAHGAQSNFLESVLHRLVGVGVTDQAAISGGAGLHAAIANSFLFSIDMGHACHPSFTEKHEVNLRPKINGGVVIKTNANQRYASTTVTRTMVLRVAKEAGVPMQEFEVRNGVSTKLWFQTLRVTDMPCGSTIGPLVSVIGLRTVDLGCAQLSMHSIREMAGTEDVTHLIRLSDAFHRHYERLDAVHTEADYDNAPLPRPVSQTPRL